MSNFSSNWHETFEGRLASFRSMSAVLLPMSAMGISFTDAIEPKNFVKRRLAQALASQDSAHTRRLSLEASNGQVTLSQCKSMSLKFH
jgi:hypothetical protein